MDTQQQPRRIATIFTLLASLLLSAAQAPAATDEFTFPSPTPGSIYHIGDTLHIEFSKTDTSVKIAAEELDFSNKNTGTKRGNLCALNAVDTVSILGHYDWIIPDSIAISATEKVSTVSDSCVIFIRNYGTHVIRGASGVFSIMDTSSSSMIASRASFSVPRAERDAKTWIDLTRAGIPGPSTRFSIDGRLQSAVNPGPGTMPPVRRGAGSSIMR